ncbi:DUF2975 domain-containing protein [Lacinutrix iliipiscaria]|uniref:DUF2975 domain-containing protein n=1 Tax=Lacinutrix iliipiscaria TaxID=1230532 RepID=A0ABW5WLE0_9FLAO
MKTKLATFRILLIIFVVLYIFALLFYVLTAFTGEHIVESMLLPFFYHFMVLIVGLGILVIEELQKRALHIKTENELTI